MQVAANEARDLRTQTLALKQGVNDRFWDISKDMLIGKVTVTVPWKIKNYLALIIPVAVAFTVATLIAGTQAWGWGGATFVFAVLAWLTAYAEFKGTKNPTVTASTYVGVDRVTWTYKHVGPFSANGSTYGDTTYDMLTGLKVSYSELMEALRETVDARLELERGEHADAAAFDDNFQADADSVVELEEALREAVSGPLSISRAVALS